MTGKRLEIAAFILAFILLMVMRTNLYNGRLANPYVTEAFVVVAVPLALYRAWRWFKGRRHG
jgi:hypothetical protein